MDLGNAEAGLGHHLVHRVAYIMNCAPQDAAHEQDSEHRENQGRQAHPKQRVAQEAPYGSLGAGDNAIARGLAAAA
jgi:hypothetical protein